jgi:hypothetical protein
MLYLTPTLVLTSLLVIAFLLVYFLMSKCLIITKIKMCFIVGSCQKSHFNLMLHAWRNLNGHLCSLIVHKKMSLLIDPYNNSNFFRFISLFKYPSYCLLKCLHHFKRSLVVNLCTLDQSYFNGYLATMVDFISYLLVLTI